MSLNGEKERDEIVLSPEVRRIRNSIIKKFADEPLDIMAKFVKEVVETEEDTVRRLGAMAARVEILRMRIAQISNSETASIIDEVANEEAEEEHTLKDDQENIVITSPNLSEWVRLRIIENSEINGVRFPKGVVIDVSHEDGDRLLESGKAAYVNEDEIEDIKTNVEAAKKGMKEVSKNDGTETNEVETTPEDKEEPAVEVEGEVSDTSAASTSEDKAEVEEAPEADDGTSEASEGKEEPAAEAEGEVSDTSVASISEDKAKVEEAPEADDGTSEASEDKEEPAAEAEGEVSDTSVASISEDKAEVEGISDNGSDAVKKVTKPSEKKDSVKSKSKSVKSEVAAKGDISSVEEKNNASSEDLLSGFTLEEESKKNK